MENKFDNQEYNQGQQDLSVFQEEILDQENFQLQIENQNKSNIQKLQEETVYSVKKLEDLNFLDKKQISEKLSVLQKISSEKFEEKNKNQISYNNKKNQEVFYNNNNENQNQKNQNNNSNFNVQISLIDIISQSFQNLESEEENRNNQENQIEKIEFYLKGFLKQQLEVQKLSLFFQNVSENQQNIQSIWEVVNAFLGKCKIKNELQLFLGIKYQGFQEQYAKFLKKVEKLMENNQNNIQKNNWIQKINVQVLLTEIDEKEFRSQNFIQQLIKIYEIIIKKIIKVQKEQNQQFIVNFCINSYQFSYSSINNILRLKLGLYEEEIQINFQKNFISVNLQDNRNKGFLQIFIEKLIKFLPQNFGYKIFFLIQENSVEINRFLIEEILLAQGKYKAQIQVQKIKISFLSNQAMFEAQEGDFFQFLGKNCEIFDKNRGFQGLSIENQDKCDYFQEMREKYLKSFLDLLSVLGDFRGNYKNQEKFGIKLDFERSKLFEEICLEDLQFIIKEIISFQKGMVLFGGSYVIKNQKNEINLNNKNKKNKNKIQIKLDGVNVNNQQRQNFENFLEFLGKGLFGCKIIDYMKIKAQFLNQDQVLNEEKIEFMSYLMEKMYGFQNQFKISVGNLKFENLLAQNSLQRLDFSSVIQLYKKLIENNNNREKQIIKQNNNQEINIVQNKDLDNQQNISLILGIFCVQFNGLKRQLSFGNFIEENSLEIQSFVGCQNLEQYGQFLVFLQGLYTKTNFCIYLQDKDEEIANFQGFEKQMWKLGEILVQLVGNQKILDFEYNFINLSENYKNYRQLNRLIGAPYKHRELSLGQCKFCLNQYLPKLLFHKSLALEIVQQFIQKRKNQVIQQLLIQKKMEKIFRAEIGKIEIPEICLMGEGFQSFFGEENQKQKMEENIDIYQQSQCIDV